MGGVLQDLCFDPLFRPMFRPYVSTLCFETGDMQHESMVAICKLPWHSSAENVLVAAGAGWVSDTEESESWLR